VLMAKKTVIIGLDGCTFDKINPLIKKGVLPNIEALIGSGTSGTLSSTIPPMTAPAWVSIGTGKNPGKTGIFDFWLPIECSYRYRMISSRDVKSPFFWEIAAKQGKKNVVINFPVTYPPEDFSGILVSGMLTPSKDSDFTLPRELKDWLAAGNIDYQIDAGWSYHDTKDKSKFLQSIIYCLNERKKAALYLMDRFEWDIFVVVFTALDRVQHFFWYDEVQGTLAHEPEKGNCLSGAIELVYRTLDDVIGEFLYRIDRFWNLFIVSDHGFSPLHKILYVNQILLDLGLLKVKEQFQEKILRGSDEDVDPSDLIHPLINLDLIDWERTQCFMPTETSQGLRFNVKGREPNGLIDPSLLDRIKEETIEKLKKVKDSHGETPLFSEVYKREEIYEGENMKLAPDLIFLNQEIKAIPLTSLTSGATLKPSTWRTGHHSPDGVFIAAGHDIKRNFRAESLRVYDVAPTLLYSMGLPVDGDMDGFVRFEIFTEDYVRNNPVKILEPVSKSGDTDERDDFYSEEDRKMLKRRLKGLGYI